MSLNFYKFANNQKKKKKAINSVTFLLLTPLFIISSCGEKTVEQPILDNSKSNSNDKRQKNDQSQSQNNQSQTEEKSPINSATIFDDKTFLENKQAENDSTFSKVSGTKVEFKNITTANLYHLTNQNKYTKLLSIDRLDPEVKNYKIKLHSEDLLKNVWLNVKTVKDEGDYYKFVGEFNDNFINILNDGTVSSTFDIYIPKTKNVSGLITSFQQLITEIRKNPSGTFKLANDISAENFELSSNSNSYLENIYFFGTLESDQGKNFTIYDLKKPLFDNLNNAKVQNLHFKNIKIKSTNYSQNVIGTVANNSINSKINNVHLSGEISAARLVGGIIGSMDDNSVIKNSSFQGNIYSLQSAGGLSGSIQKRSSIEDSYANVNITSKLVNSDKLGGIVAELGSDSSLKNIVVEGNILNNGTDQFPNSGGLIGFITTNGTKDLPDTGVVQNIYAKIKTSRVRPIFGNFNKKNLFDYEKKVNNINFVENFSDESFSWLKLIDENTFH